MTTVDPQTAIFSRQVRSRSHEHRTAMNLLASARLAGQMVAVLRQELDSMVRVIYLLDQSVERRTQLVGASVAGKRWPGVTDKEMVELAQKLQGWTRSVYKFGCSFIHLSALHDYNDRDPLALLSTQERSDILDHCRYYHGGPMQDDADFADLVRYLPRVLEKIASNLDGYTGALERGEALDHEF
jgi:hypothetical protein